MAGNTYISSDPHAWHGNILLYSGRTKFMTGNDFDQYNESYLKTGKRFKISDESIDNMNKGMVAEINKVADKKDTLICCGDWAFGYKGNYYNNCRWFRDQIICDDVRLIIGNHDNPDRIYDLFSRCQEMATWIIDGQEFTFCHYPMCVFPHSHKGAIMAYGHVHGIYKDAGARHPMARPHLWCAFDVGVDTNDFKPYSVPQLREMAKPIWEAQRQSPREYHHFV